MNEKGKYKLKSNEELALEIVTDIWCDLDDRIGYNLNNLDEELKAETVQVWVGFIFSRLRFYKEENSPLDYDEDDERDYAVDGCSPRSHGG